MEKIKQYDAVLLKDGRRAAVVEIYGNQDVFDVDVGSSPKDWDTITVKRDEIEKIIND
ncbi:hypothetical protein [Christensenella minuta]|uniref:Uncharacterized protein n=1 Tax=Christensenella minuta TaxID=626937 RepID=A0A136Q8M5_9FIRM|nr:hypothetical protein [Christensenella minuta]KXK66954.1 hypothetical protein HMPREF3293_00184 [Christensenella minuta]